MRVFVALCLPVAVSGICPAYTCEMHIGFDPPSRITSIVAPPHEPIDAYICVCHSIGGFTGVSIRLSDRERGPGLLRLDRPSGLSSWSGLKALLR
jgi:hypothetical protein